MRDTPAVCAISGDRPQGRSGSARASSRAGTSPNINDASPGEVEEIASLLKLDWANINSRERDARTPLLEMMRRTLIVSEVVTS
jgi:hypothetical protein